MFSPYQNLLEQKHRSSKQILPISTAMHSHLTPPPPPTHYSWGPGYPVTNYGPASHRWWVCPGAPQSVGLMAVPCILGLGSVLKAT